MAIPSMSYEVQQLNKRWHEASAWHPPRTPDPPVLTLPSGPARVGELATIEQIEAVPCVFNGIVFPGLNGRWWVPLSREQAAEAVRLADLAFGDSV